MKIFVTGGAGSVGRYIIKSLIKKNHNITIVDNLSNSAENAIKPFLDKVDFVKGDITNYDDISNSIKGSDVVIHLAAKINVQESFANPNLTKRVNVDGAKNLLKACKENNITNIITASSAAVYGLGNRSIFKETDPCFPVSNYALSKYCGEQQSRLYYELYDLPTTSIRFFSVYGSPQIHKKVSHSWAVAIFGALAK